MLKKINRLLAFLAVTLVIPVISFAQETPGEVKKGLDQRINEWFQPITDWWSSIVFYTVNIGGVNVPIVVILLVSGAAFFTIYFSFVNIRRFRLAIQVVRGKHDDLEKDATDVKPGNVNVVSGDIVDTIKDESHHGEVNHFQALATAVSGTVGLGNIAGLAMSSKFVECTLGVKYRDIDKNGVVYGGPMYYLTKGFKELKLAGLGKFLAILFAILCVGGSLGGGSAFQSNQAAQQIASMTGMESSSSGFFIGLGLAIITGIVIIGGIKKIATVTEKIVPFMAILYIIASLIIIFANFSFIDDVFRMIFNEAFTPRAGLGGLMGVLIVGFKRAAFSNEAGAGSASIAHSAVKTKYPASEGVVSLLEPFIDTVVICTMTALVIIMFNKDGLMFPYGGDGKGSVVLNATGGSTSGVDLTSMAYNEVIPHFSYVLTIAIVLFAFSTMISWSYYGLQAWKFLFGRGKIADLSYKVLFLAFVVNGASVSLSAVTDFSDAMILAMVFPNMIGLLFLFPKVREELKRYLAAIKNSKK